MQIENVDDFVAVFGDNGKIAKLAEQTPAVDPAAWPDPYESQELQSLAKQGNVVALAIYGLHDRFQDSSPAVFLDAVKTAGEVADSFYKFADGNIAGSQDVMSNFRRPYSVDPKRYSGLMDQAGVVAQWWPGTIGGIPNKPGPLSSLAVMGMLGAGAGNLAGRALSYHPAFDSETVTNRATALGGLLGLLPGAAYMGMNAMAGKSALGGRVLELKKQSLLDPTLFSRPNLIPVEQLQHMIWEDPDVAGRLPIHIAAATSALVEGANRHRRSETPFVTPADIARMAVGLGSGYTSGLLVGKALGGLFGVSDSAQEVLRRSGAAAGLLQTFVPLAFGA